MMVWDAMEEKAGASMLLLTAAEGYAKQRTARSRADTAERIIFTGHKLDAHHRDAIALTRCLLPALLPAVIGAVGGERRKCRTFQEEFERFTPVITTP